MFTFGGCQPNGNNFDSEDLCYEACQSGDNFIDETLTDSGNFYEMNIAFPAATQKR